MNHEGLSRRAWLRTVGMGLAGACASPWFRNLSLAAEVAADRKRSLIVLWLNGGPSTIDLFDLKPEHANGGPFKPAQTKVPGLLLSEHLPRMAERSEHLALVRSMSTKEGDHGRASFVARTGVAPQGAIRFPAFGAAVGKELANEAAELPSAVCIAPRRNPDLDGHTAGFLGSRFAPLLIGENSTYNSSAADPGRVLHVANLQRPTGVASATQQARLSLLQQADGRFAGRHRGAATSSHQASVDRAVRLMQDHAARTFDLDDEPAKTREAYGKSLFGQGCLLARRLVERDVPFVEVTLDGWDTHQNNFDRVAELSRTLDQGWGALVDDLKDRGMLDSTLVVCLGEFGRTPKINGNAGRDHYPAAWSVALAGGGIRGGALVGRTSEDGMAVADRPTSIPDLLATVCQAMGVDPLKQNISNVSRPIRIVDKSARPLEELL
jgi:hypothetical protein